MMNLDGLIDEKLIAENADFLKAVVGAKSIEEAKGVCDQYDIELPAEAWQEVVTKMKTGSDELTEEELCDVAGGFDGGKLLTAVGGIAGLGTVIAAGSAPGVLVACAVIGYNAFKAFR